MYRLRTVALLLSLLTLGACSSTTFFYNRLHLILPWYLDDYVDLNREQDAYLDAALQPVLDWHRRDELPRYIEILDNIEGMLDQPVAASDVADIALQFERSWYRLEDKLLGFLLDLGARLSDEQMAAFLEKLWKKQRKYEEKYLKRSEEKYREDSYEDLLDSLQDYLGRLSKDQRSVLRNASEQLLRSDGVWLTERAAWLNKLEIILQREEGWQQRVLDAVAQRDEEVSSTYRDTYAHNLDVIQEAIALVLDDRSDRQDRHLRSELADLKEDLQTLIAQVQR